MADSEPRQSGSDDCFVIAPIGDRHAEIGTDARTIYEEGIQLWEQVIEPACREAGLSPIRADQMTRGGEIPEHIFRSLRDFDFVIADVTGGNPNVMYELGLRHTKAKATIQLGQAQRLPFDIAAIRTIVFSRTEGGLIDARQRLVAALRSARVGEFDPVTATRLWNTDSSAEREFEEPLVQQEEDEAPGFLELLVQMEEAIPNLSVTTQLLTALNTDFVDVMRSATQEVESSDARGGGSSQRLAIAIRFAEQLDGFAEQFEGLATQYEEQMRAADPGVAYLLSELEADPSKLSEVGEFPQGLLTLGDQLTEMNDHIDANASIIGGFGQIARPLRKPANRLATALRRLTNANVAATNWAARAERLAPRDGDS